MTKPDTQSLPPVGSLVGRTALITGAAHGLGAALAAGLFLRGANVLLADIDRDAVDARALGLDDSGARAQSVHIDLSEEGAAAVAIEAAKSRWGVVDILVNNAAVTGTASLWEIEPAEWDRVMAVNLRAAFLLSRLAGAGMRARGHGCMINIASLAGQVARPDGIRYATSKGGLLAMARVFAAELAPYGVTVNAVAPAILDTTMLTRIGAERAAAPVAAIPTGRVGKPEDVAALRTLPTTSMAARSCAEAKRKLNGEARRDAGRDCCTRAALRCGYRRNLHRPRDRGPARGPSLL